MKFPIDVIFLDKESKVVNLIPAMSPYRSSGIHLAAYSVLELPSGTIKKSHTEVGDQLDITLAESSEMDDLKESRLSQIG
jgi:hypothetical protein